ncbi:hypothetical protein HYV80_07320 [Candidatus Woesearchaeota archaeon]|nr:hypothetical protein [Candidatus Woesearchaeota archaeon]
MGIKQLNAFQIIPLVIGLGATFFGFKLIKEVYLINNSQISWLFVLAVFNWLSLIVLLIFLSLILDASKKGLGKLDVVIYLLSRGKKK